MLTIGHVAQWLEYVATNYSVGGSNPSLPNFFFGKNKNKRDS